jgi:uncharacterized protein YkwD
MKQLKCILMFLFLVGNTFTSNAQLWKSKDYQLHDHHSFFKLEIFHQIIDEKKVDRSLLHAAMFYATNEQREKQGLEPFRHQEKFEKVAADHAADMVKYDFYSHVSVVKGKKTVRDRFLLEGINPKMVAENISSSYALNYQIGRKVYPPKNGIFQYSTGDREEILPHTYLSYARDVVRLWMESPGHRANILNPQFHYLGCGAMIFSLKTFFNMPYFKAVQCFGSDQ